MHVWFQVKAYFSFHSFGEMIIFPWSYTESPIDDSNKLQKTGNKLAKWIKKFRGKKYSVRDIKLLSI